MVKINYSYSSDLHCKVLDYFIHNSKFSFEEMKA